MPIINVNAFQNGINKKNYLTTYTDAYLKQSLANLGQRTAAKGDSIGFSSFNIQDLFPNYTGDFNEENLLVQIVLDPSLNRVSGYLKLLKENGDVESLSETEANTKFEVDNIDYVIRGLIDDFDEDNIKLSDVTQINNVDYWHKESATFCKTTNSLIYKLVGHKSAGVYGDYDNEYICEEVSDNGEFIEGFRIFIVNEMNLMQCNDTDADPNGPNSENAHEKLALIHLHKNLDKNDLILREHEWVLDVYSIKENIGEGTNSIHYIGLGDAKDLLEESRIDELIAKFADSSNNSTPGTIISNIVDTIINGSAINQLSGMIQKKYSIPIDYDTEENANWSIPNSFIEKWKSLSDDLSFSGKGKRQMAPDANGDSGIQADIDIISGNTLTFTTGKLEYFVSDKTQLYPRLLSIYNQVMYKSASNIKVKERIITELARTCWQRSLKTASVPNDKQVYTMYLPTNYEFKYNCNSNDESLIYNMTSSIPVQFENVNNIKDNTIIQAAENNVFILDKIVWKDGNEPTQYIFANNEVQHTVLYDMAINYSPLDDNIIISIEWNINFVMPFISSNGYWVINGIETTNYAKGIINELPNLIMIVSDDLEEFNPSTKILTGAGLNELKGLSGSSFQKKTFKSNYIDTNVNVGNENCFNMQAWVPSDEYLKSIKNSESFSYLSSAIIMNMCSTSLEKDSTYIQYAYYDGSSLLYPSDSPVIGNQDKVTTTYISNKYNKENLDDWKIGSDNSYSYIYRIAKKSNTIESLIGGQGIVTSFWVCEEKEDPITNTTYYAFDYIKNPNKDNALDFNYICNLEQYIKYYSKNSFSPDDYEHTQLVFDPVLQFLKNNTNNGQSKIWPVILNHNADYYNPTIGIDITKGLGMADDANQQYYNSMNLAVEFVDDVEWNENQKITKTENSLEGRRFGIESYTTTYIEHFNKFGITYANKDNTNPILGLTDGVREEKKVYGVIPKVINYTNFKNEYIPNSEYTPNGPLGNQYPTVDMKEATIRNVNVWNRNNILIADNKQFNPLVSYGVIYNAYIGSAYDQEDNSILHIGTSNTNINLGTTSMVSKDDISRLTKMSKIQIDFDNIELNGYTMTNGELMTKHPLWTVTDNGNYHTYTTILRPLNKLENVERIESGKIPSATDSVLSNVKFNIRKRKSTRYYNDVDEYRNVSYLNLSRYLLENGVPNDEGTIWYGDERLLTKRKKIINQEKIEMYNRIVNMQVNYPGVLQMKFSYFADAQNTYSNINDANRYLNDVENENIKYKAISTYRPTYNDWIKYNLAQVARIENNIRLYDVDSKTGNSISIIGYKMEEVNNQPTYCYDDDGNKITYNVTGSAYTCYFDNLYDELNSTGHYLELSTDLTDKENKAFDGCVDNDLDNKYMDGNKEVMVIGNPIQVSYTDVNSYTSTLTYIVDTYITTFTYALSYNEYWSCDGCNMCSQKTCPIINKCSKSKCQGFFTPSYGFAEVTANEKPEDIVNKNVLSYTHTRYKLNSDNQYEKYEVKSYWPLTEYLTKEDFNSDKEFSDFITRVNPETLLKEQLTYYPSTNEYKWEVITEENSKYVTTRVPIGKNIICAYNMDYITYFSDLHPEYNVKVGSVPQSSISYFNKEGDSNIEKYIRFTYKYYELEGPKEATFDGVKETYYTLEEKEGNMKSQFSYVIPLTKYAYIPSFTRHINVRELITSHTVPEFYNERLCKYNINENVESPMKPNDTPNFNIDIPGLDNRPDALKPTTPKPVEKAYKYMLKVISDDVSVNSLNGIVDNSLSDMNKVQIYVNNTYVSVKQNKDILHMPFTIDATYKCVDKVYKGVKDLEGNLIWKYDEDTTMENLENSKEISKSNDYTVTFKNNNVQEKYEKVDNTYKLIEAISLNSTSNFNSNVVIKFNNIEKNININFEYKDKLEERYEFGVLISNTSNYDRENTNAVTTNITDIENAPNNYLNDTDIELTELTARYPLVLNMNKDNNTEYFDVICRKTERVNDKFNNEHIISYKVISEITNTDKSQLFDISINDDTENRSRKRHTIKLRKELENSRKIFEETIYIMPTAGTYMNQKRRIKIVFDNI